MSELEVVDATAHDVAVSVVTQRGAVVGLELLLSEGAIVPGNPGEPDSPGQ